MGSGGWADSRRSSHMTSYMTPAQPMTQSFTSSQPMTQSFTSSQPMEGLFPNLSAMGLYPTQESPCHVCGQVFMSKEMLRIHAAEHSEGFHKCPACQKVFFTKQSLSQHKRIVHALVRRHPCHLCDKRLSTRQMLKEHYLRLHKQPMPPKE